jgi:hypothetical protein
MLRRLGERRVVAGGAEHGQSLFDQGGQLLGRALRLEKRA